VQKDFHPFLSHMGDQTG